MHIILIRRLIRLFHLLLPFIGRELREQYAGSVLGSVWSVLQPLCYVLLYWWVFSVVMRTRFPVDSALAHTPFIVFLLSALLPWFAFQEGLQRAAGAILARRELVCKVRLPAMVFPLAAVIAAFIVHIGSYALFLAVLWAQGLLTWTALVVIIVLLGLQLIATAGLGLFLSALTVYLRDTAQVLGVLLAILFYTAPILYPLMLAPPEFQTLLWLNPATAFAEGFHAAALTGSWPTPTVLIGLLTFSCGALVGGLSVFRRLQPGFADVL